MTSSASQQPRARPELCSVSETKVRSADAGSFAGQPVKAALLAGFAPPLRLLAVHRRCYAHPGLLCGSSPKSQWRSKRKCEYAAKQYKPPCHELPPILSPNFPQISSAPDFF
jgi:hypothetical protein